MGVIRATLVLSGGWSIVYRTLIKTSCYDLILAKAEKPDSANKFYILARHTLHICQQFVLYQTSKGVPKNSIRFQSKQINKRPCIIPQQMATAAAPRDWSCLPTLWFRWHWGPAARYAARWLYQQVTGSRGPFNHCLLFQIDGSNQGDYSTNSQDRF